MKSKLCSLIVLVLLLTHASHVQAQCSSSEIDVNWTFRLDREGLDNVAYDFIPIGCDSTINLVPLISDIPGNVLVQGGEYWANPYDINGTASVAHAIDTVNIPDETIVLVYDFVSLEDLQMTDPV